MQAQFPITDTVVLIGGGHSHALVLKMWAMNPVPGVKLTVINPAPTAPYTGMLPGHIAGHYDRDDLEIDLVRLARHAGARLVLGAVTGIDRTAKRVQVQGRADIAYDIASFDVGITSNMAEIAGFDRYAHAAKPLGPYAVEWHRFLADQTRRRQPVAVIGGGVGGVELALAMAHRLGGTGGGVTVLEQGPHLLEGIGSAARRALIRHMQRLGVTPVCNARVDKIEPGRIRLHDGTTIQAGFTVGAAGARPHGWLKDTGLTNDAGFITVSETLQTLADPSVFAVGDCAHMGFAPRPKAGVFAVRQAPVLDQNLRALLCAGRLQRFRPQRDYLKLISTGGRGAVADKWGLRLDGASLWRLKDRIDRTFMRRFKDLPDMAADAVPAGASVRLQAELADAPPLCGGCGAKMAGGDLAGVLATLPRPGHADVLSGPGDDAAILRHGQGFQVLTTDHLRAFVDDPYLMTEIAAAHALGDIHAMGARPQSALLQVILPRLSPRLQAEMLREITAAASRTMAANGADIVGGHTSIGAELTIGFALTGTSETPPVGLSGARPGDVLILTKPIGSGTLLAAEMRKKARGDDVAAAYNLMRRDQAAAGPILAPVARAMTDVTGFGLAGHLLRLLEASGCAAHLDLAEVPVMAGALDLASAGIKSSIWSANAQEARRISPQTGPRWSLLFDPQTSGGLLAAIPAELAPSALDALQSAGEPAARIGTLTAGDAFITL